MYTIKISEETRLAIKLWVHSAAATFLTGFFVVLAPSVQSLDFSNIEAASLWGLIFATARMLVKPLWAALWQGIVGVIVWIADQLHTRKNI